jgi:peptide/nickel transport system substrate-binding protein
VLASRNAGWWGKASNIENVRYIFRSESSVRAAMVGIGEADFAPAIAEADAKDPALDVSYPNSETLYLRIEMGRAPLNDVRVRKALNLAFDRYSIRGTVLSKDSMLATQIVGPGVAGHNFEIDKRVWPFDPEKARQLVAEAKAAGVPVGDEVWLVGRANHFPGVTELHEAAANMFNAVGLNVKLRMVEVAQIRELSNKPASPNRPPILISDQHDNNNGDAVLSMFNKMATEGGQSFLSDKHVDALIAQASALSGPERIKTWQEAQRIIYEDLVAHVWMYHMVSYSRVGKRIVFKPSVTTNSEIQISQMSLK